MLTEEDFARFKEFKVAAMGEKLREIVNDPSYDSWTFEEKMKAIIDAQVETKMSNKIAKLNRAARFKLPEACVEDIVYLPDRKITKDRMMRLAMCEWVEKNENIVVISKTGCGKSHVAQALGNAACRKLYTVRYVRLADICKDLNSSRAQGVERYYESMDRYLAPKLLIIDDFLTTPISTTNAVDLFEIVEGRDKRGSTFIASQLEPEEWYLRIESELIADSIMNRISVGSRYFDLKGPNMREYFADLKRKEESTN